MLGLVANCARTPPMLLPVDPLPWCDSRSRMSTLRKPASVRCHAMLAPTIPPPTITTSAVCISLGPRPPEHCILRTNQPAVIQAGACMPISSVVQILTASIAPVIVISGVGLLLLSISNRYGRALDRARLIMRELQSGAAGGAEVRHL